MFRAFLIFIFLFVYYWKTLFLSHMKQYRANDTKEINWKKFGSCYGLLRGPFPLFS